MAKLIWTERAIDSLEFFFNIVHGSRLLTDLHIVEPK